MDGLLKKSDRIILLVGICIGCIALAHPHLGAFFDTLFSSGGLSEVNGERIVIEDAKVTVPELAEGKTSIDLNKARPEKLEELPGVGPVLAERIVQYREEKGGFSSVDELTEVSGIGTAKLQELKEEVTVDT